MDPKMEKQGIDPCLVHAKHALYHLSYIPMSCQLIWLIQNRVLSYTHKKKVRFEQILPLFEYLPD